MSIILLNLLVGPPMFRYALFRVGEAKSGHALGLPTKSSSGDTPPIPAVVALLTETVGPHSQ